MRLVFLLEEPSMKILLEGLLPRLFPGLDFVLVPHEGKRDLEKSIPRKLKAWNDPKVRFVVVEDNDGGDCSGLKSKLRFLCEQAGQSDTLVRIVCQELEAWYLGEPEALAEAYGNPKLAKLAAKAKFREPDALIKPSVELERLVPEFQKLAGARLLGSRLTETRNRSPSFRCFIAGVGRMVEP
ncbi:protein of unknown function [Methylomagnum ishizawai]|uniref:DUF4276 domain-containing protein n=2 Tax=Methylomagnum ishizawai TaxID=1760988 RepID=A0A1Y6D273_9GAMM|nr:protein of unknown function [Methylomagnum ishizawai]